MQAAQRIPVRRLVELTRAAWMGMGRKRARVLAARCRSTGIRKRNADTRRKMTRGRTASTAYTDSALTVEPENVPDRWTSYERLQQLNEALAFAPLTDDDKARLEAEAKEHYADNSVDRKVCAVKDTWVFRKSAEQIPIDNLPFLAMRKLLSGLSWITPAIESYYDCSDIDERLKGMLLSRRAFQQDTDGKACVWISCSAINDLRATEMLLTQSNDFAERCKPPKFSIADSFVAGAYHELDALTYVERQAVGLVQIRGVIKVVYGGPGNVLQSHLLCWDNRDATVASRVPSVVGKEQFQLILAGPMTQPQELLLAQRHECSGDRVHSAHELLRRVNPLYSDMDYNVDFDEERPNDDTFVVRLDANDDTENLVAQARARQSTVARMNDAPEDPSARECTLVETQTVLVETVPDHTEHDRLARAYANVTGHSGRYIARRSSSILKSNDPSYMERLFPHLLSFGVGGFTTPRRHRYTQREIVLHYLDLSTNTFAEDPIFKLAMFDHLSTMRVKNNVFLRVGQDPALATTVMQVSPEQLEVAMTNRTEQRKAWKLGRTHVPIAESPMATATLKSIHASASKMWGSNEEREALTRKVDAMTIHFGAPSVFWTLTPNPDCSLTCAFWTGQQLPNGRPDDFSKCSERHMPCSADMARLVMSNTVVQAHYYRLCSYILIDILFGWDSKAHKPKAQRGIFGHAEALVYALEQQGRLFIHHHGVAWIAGMPKTQSDWDTVLASEELRTRFEKYCTSIFASELPLYNGITTLSCPHEDCGGELEPVDIDKKYKHLLKPSVAAPVVAVCSSCNSRLCENDVVSALINNTWNSLDEEHKNVSTRSAVEAIRHKFGGLSSDTATANLQLTRLLMMDQVHSFTHARSCIKGRRGTKCRYNFFRQLVDASGLYENNEIVYKRRIGNQWLNTFIELWCRIFHFNMDSRILWTGQGLQAARYALQYTVKRQTVFDNVAVIEMAHKKRVKREKNVISTEYARGVGRLLALTYAATGVMEIGAPLATGILMEGEAVKFTCLFVRLVIIEALNMLDKRTVEAIVVLRDEQLVVETSIAKYVERPKCLEDYCWYDFCRWFDRVGSKTTGQAHLCTFAHTTRSELREHLKMHGFRYFDFPHVPEIIGPRLPDATRLQDEDYTTQRELYYRMVLLLYHPFRDIGSLLDDSASAQACYTRWAPWRDAKTSRALERHQQYYICLRIAEEYRQKQKQTTSDSTDDDEICLDEDVQQSTDMSAEGSRTTHSFTTIPAELYCVDEDVGMEAGNGDIPTENLTAIQHLLLQSITTTPLPVDCTNYVIASADAITRKQVNIFQRDQIALQVNDGEGDAAHVPTHVTTPEVIVESYQRALRNISAEGDGTSSPEIEPYASIRDVSKHFHLNADQHVAFSLIAVPLLSAIAGIPVPDESSEVYNSSPMIITGAGGTGKSQIISAVRTLAHAWNRPDAIKVVASTGIAAAGLNGCTMHSSVGLGINTTRLPKHIESPSDTLIRQWAPVVCVIADEVSMVDLSFLSLWETSLRHVKEAHDQPFGGMIAVLMFDHCQLGTVRGNAIYKTSSGDSPLPPIQDRGRHLYRGINKAIYLTQNMRFLEDPVWGQWLEKARLGQWPAQLRSFIRALPEFEAEDHPRHPGMIQTISTDNTTRAMVNDTAIQTAVRTFQAERKVYVISAKLSRQVSPFELAVIRTLTDNKTGNIPVFLHLYIGMPVRVKVNQCFSKGVVNGASGTVYHIDWPPNTTFTLQPNSTWLPSKLPTNIFIDIATSASPTRFPNLPLHWPPSVMPVYEVTSTVTIHGPPLSIRGFPIVPAFGTTVHGVQGDTRDAVAITNLRPPSCRRVDPHALYVALSRLRTRHGLHWIGEKPTVEDYDFFGPSSAVLLEDARLRQLSARTVAAFHQLAHYGS